MITHTYRIPYQRLGQTITIKPISDVHYGSRQCDVRAFKKYLNESDDDTYFIGMGDYHDAIIVSDLKRYQKDGDGTRGAAIVDEQVEGMIEMLTPFKDRIIGLGTGNHETEILKRCGTDMTNRLCVALGAKNLGYSWLTTINLRKSHGAGRSIVIRGHHGWGGGSRTAGGNITKFFKDTNNWDADVFLYGHVHDKDTKSKPRLGMSGNKLIARPKVVAICGTFLKTYSVGHDVTYSERSGYDPVDVGGIMLRVQPWRDGIKYWVEL